MLKIAICEDDEQAALLCHSYIERFEKESKTTCEVSVFVNAVQFLAAFTAGDYDLIFMDIQMPILNGVDAAGKLREKDPAVSIVFVTDMKNRIADGYAVEAMDFIIKPMTYFKFEIVMKRAMKRQTRKKAEVFLTSGGEAYRVAVEEILYVEVNRNRCFYHTEDGVIEIWSSLKKEEVRLRPYSFAKANSCYLVNLAHVRSLSGDTVQVGSEALAISRSRRKDLMEAFTAYAAENHL